MRIADMAKERRLFPGGAYQSSQDKHIAALSGNHPEISAFGRKLDEAVAKLRR